MSYPVKENETLIMRAVEDQKFKILSTYVDRQIYKI